MIRRRFFLQRGKIFWIRRHISWGDGRKTECCNQFLCRVGHWDWPTNYTSLTRARDSWPSRARSNPICDQAVLLEARVKDSFFPFPQKKKKKPWSQVSSKHVLGEEGLAHNWMRHVCIVFFLIGEATSQKPIYPVLSPSITTTLPTSLCRRRTDGKARTPASTIHPSPPP